MAAGAGGRGKRGGASRRRIPRDGRGRNKDGEGETIGATRAAKRITAATKTTAAQVRRRSSKMGNLQVSSDGVGREYRVEVAGREESADKNAE